MKRSDGRLADELRPVSVERGYLNYAEGSCLFSAGSTRVLCSASVEDRVPPFLVGSRQGWVTAEYAMLPGSTKTRTLRERTPKGRSQEIQRLIGRSLRAVIDLEALGERTISLDCDVIQADGGTRTASICGATIALHDALTWMIEMGLIETNPLREFVAATSVGIVKGERLLDLCYAEDSVAQVDFNVVMTASGEFVELQGTAEEKPFDRAGLDEMLSLASKGIGELIDIQKTALGLV